MHTETSNITLVTGLWDIKRSELTEGWNRSFEDHYITKFKQLLEVPYNLIVFGESTLRDTVFSIRTKENTQFIERSQDWFKNEFFDKIQQIRSNPDWYNQAGWLKDSTQGSLEMYNPLVMSKMFILNDAKVFDQFNSEYLFWIDAGISTTVHPGYFTKDRVLDKLENKLDKFLFVTFPYKANTEIHGFSYPDINDFAGDNVDLVCRGGFFGGPVELISDANGIYYSMLSDTLNKGYMGTEESIFSIILYKYPEIFSYSEITENGLLGTFFENLKNDKFNFKSIGKNKSKKGLDLSKVGVYVITYNSPNQFENLCKSFINYDRNFIDRPKKFLLNNSLDSTTDERYKELCDEFGFEEIKKDNLGICGGRQFIAEHFEDQKELDFYFFFEDDMFFYGGTNTYCKNGFNRKIEKIYNRSLEIANNEEFDFLKLNFTEFYGDNTKQWAWHNVPGDVRKNLFPEKPVKKNNNINQAPFLNFKNIKSHKSLPYATGEIYYCNWPQIISRDGNRKMFLETKWKFPYEQTWMSHFYQETIQGRLKPGILLATPTEHDRFEFYSKEERREN